jgi:hypothetical protein
MVWYRQYCRSGKPAEFAVAEEKGIAVTGTGWGMTDDRQSAVGQGIGGKVNIRLRRCCGNSVCETDDKQSEDTQQACERAERFLGPVTGSLHGFFNPCIQLSRSVLKDDLT